MAPTRTFIAVHLPIELREALQSICEQLKHSPGGSAARWVTTDNIHLTLKFLGDVDNSRLPAVHQAIADACVGIPPFRVAVSGLGCFPNYVRPRIACAGFGCGAPALVALAKVIDQSLSKLGFPNESRPFSAHITLARTDRRATNAELAALGKTIASQSRIGIGEMSVASVSMVKSDLRATGPVYTNISVAYLSPRPKAEA